MSKERNINQLIARGLCASAAISCGDVSNAGYDSDTCGACILGGHANVTTEEIKKLCKAKGILITK